MQISGDDNIWPRHGILARLLRLAYLLAHEGEAANIVASPCGGFSLYFIIEQQPKAIPNGAWRWLGVFSLMKRSHYDGGRTPRMTSYEAGISKFAKHLKRAKEHGYDVCVVAIFTQQYPIWRKQSIICLSEYFIEESSDAEICNGDC